MSCALKTAAVTVVIVNWNCGDYLAQCVDGLLRQTLPPEKILIMDNGSTDRSLQTIAADERIDIRRLGSNLGFAAANNRAFALCTTPYVALLNPDAWPQPDWLERLLEAARRHPDRAAFGSLQLCAENPAIVDGAGDDYHISGLVWRAWHGRRRPPQAEDYRPIFSPCAAAALYRLQALRSVGGFDEDFFCYVEDVDLGFRLQLAGLPSLLVERAIVRHVGSAATGGQRSDFCVYHGHRNLVWAFVKNMPPVLFWSLLPLHAALNLVSLLYFARRGQGRLIVRAKYDAVKGLAGMWRKRRAVQRQRRVSTAAVWRILSKSFGNRSR